MSKERPSQHPSDKGFENKEAKLLASDSRAAKRPQSRFWRVVALIMEGGALCYLPWMTSDLVGNVHRPWYVTGLIFAAILVLIGHIGYSILMEYPASGRTVWLSGTGLGILLLALVIWNNIVNDTPSKDWQPPAIPRNYDYVWVEFANIPVRLKISEITGRKLELPFYFGATTNYDWPVFRSREPFSNAASANITPIYATAIDRRIYLEVRLPLMRKVLEFDDRSGGSFLSGNSKLEVGLLTIQANRPVEQLPFNWDCNHNNSAVEIVDERGMPMCQVIYTRSDKIDVFGCFSSSNRFVASYREGTTFGVAPFNPTNLIPKRLFKYPSSEYPGVVNH
jgi:hypothetical protein